MLQQQLWDKQNNRTEKWMRKDPDLGRGAWITSGCRLTARSCGPRGFSCGTRDHFSAHKVHEHKQRFGGSPGATRRSAAAVRISSGGDGGCARVLAWCPNLKSPRTQLFPPQNKHLTLPYKRTHDELQRAERLRGSPDTELWRGLVKDATLLIASSLFTLARCVLWKPQGKSFF